MQVHELAKECEVDNKEVMNFLKKQHHLATVTDEEANMFRIAKRNGALSDGAVKMARFWSKNRDQRIARPDGSTIRFRNYHYITEDGSSDCKLIRSIPHPDIVEVVNEPFKDETQAVTFRKELQALVFTGSMGEISRERGMTAITALFEPGELDVLKDKMWNPEAIIERAIRTKSVRK
jgi:hypothetical protein